MSNINTIVSVIVPIYKVEKYIKRCIDSIINQSYKHIEIILVDDGSPDMCGRICDDYSKLDNRIKVIHKSNGGLSDARNYGINVASGEYIIFVDSDDYIETNTIETLINYAKNKSLDVICGNAYRITISDSNSNINKTVLIGGTTEDVITTGEEYIVQCIRNRKFSVAVWTRMYSTKLIKDNNIYFKKGILHEDENWTPKLLLKAKRVSYCNFTFYNYIIRDDSITQTMNKQKHIVDIINTCKELEYEYNKLKSINNKKILKDYLVKLYINTSTYGDFNKIFYNTVIDKRFVLSNASLLKTRIEAIIYCLNISLYRYIKLKFS